MDLEAYSWACGSTVRSAQARPSGLATPNAEAAEAPSSADEVKRPLQAQGLASLWASAVLVAAEEGMLEEDEVEAELGPFASSIARAAKDAGPGPSLELPPLMEEAAEEAVDTADGPSGYPATEKTFPEPAANVTVPGASPATAEGPAAPEPEKLEQEEEGFLGVLSAWSDTAPASRLLEQARLDEAARKGKVRVSKQPAESSSRARPLKKTCIEEVRSRFPSSRAKTPPPESKRWSKEELELYFGSDGVLRPRTDPPPSGKEELAQEMRQASLTSTLLGKMRMQLAEDKISDPPSEYASLCQHLRCHSGDLSRLPVAEVVQIPRQKKVPPVLKAPLCIEARRGWKMRTWGMAFWSYECGEAPCQCFRSFPPSPEDSAKALEARADEFTKYVGVVRDMDPLCLEDSYLAYPRFFGAWSPFHAAKARKLWDQDWNSGRKLWAPPGFKDLSARWLEILCPAVGLDAVAETAALDQIQFGPPGAITRLHVANNSAHVWYAQTQGRRTFLLFAPQERSNLYAEQSEPAPATQEVRLCSPVDIFRQSQRHSRFRDSRAQIATLEPGETLIVPSGWWHSSVALEPFTTLTRRFWNRTNRQGMCEEIAHKSEVQDSGPEQRSRLASQLPWMREQIQQDDCSSDDD